MLRSTTARMMLCWSHYRFRKWLLYKASISGSKVYVRSEAYTSKTCTACGHIKEDLGGAKRYCCAQCGLRIDRDAAAARNIFMRNVLLTLRENTEPGGLQGPSGIASLEPGGPR